MDIPEKRSELKKLALDVRDVCMHSVGQRQAQCRKYRKWIETGRENGNKSLHNRLYSHTDRLQSYLFSPFDLRFSIDFENQYPKDILDKAETVSRVLTREWERASIDVVFAEGVKSALDYGACIIKGLVKRDEDDIDISARLVMPWMFGVYRDDVNNIYDQEAVCEVAYMTKPEVWRRVSHLPDAEKLYAKICASASANTDGDGVNSFFHQVLSTSTLQTGASANATPLPGGIVSLTNNDSDIITMPDLGADVIKFHELWLWDDEAGDYVTVQIFDGDVLVAPLYKKCNLFCPDKLPYGLIQPNMTAGYFWGRSEIVDMTEPQGLLSTWLDDVRRLIGVQYDKLLAFTGGNGITDEIYDQFRSNGFLNLDQGSDVKDITPKLPSEALQCIEMIIKFMDDASGFGNILSGQGESGVRAGNHAQTLMKTASPRLRDRALITERQCATFADSILAVMEAKSDKVYWTEPDNDESKEFLLSQLPDDRRVFVDSHSGSPIYEDDHKDMIGFLAKSGAIGPDSILDLLPGVPQRELLKIRFKEMQAKKAEEQKMLAEHPELIPPKHPGRPKKN